MSEYRPVRKKSSVYSATLISAVGQLQMFSLTLSSTLTTPKMTATSSRQLEPCAVSQAQSAPIVSPPEARSSRLRARAFEERFHGGVELRVAPGVALADGPLHEHVD